MFITFPAAKGRAIYYQVGGGRLYSGGGGVGIFFGDVLGGGVKIKIPWGRVEGHIFHQEFVCVCGGGGGQMCSIGFCFH